MSMRSCSIGGPGAFGSAAAAAPASTDSVASIPITMEGIMAFPGRVAKRERDGFVTSLPHIFRPIMKYGNHVYGREHAPKPCVIITLCNPRVFFIISREWLSSVGSWLRPDKPSDSTRYLAHHTVPYRTLFCHTRTYRDYTAPHHTTPYYSVSYHTTPHHTHVYIRMYRYTHAYRCVYIYI